MAQIILDFGSGNTSRNDLTIVKRMIDELKAVDTGKHEVIIKWQLFEKAGQNVPLLPETFEYACEYAEKLGYKTTASIFDLNSLKFLLDYDVPFVKIANRRDLDWLIGKVPREIPVYVSGYCGNEPNTITMRCVSKYPATLKDYEDEYMGLKIGAVSDHTINFDLWDKYKPEIIEWHYGLSDSTGLDAGPFMKTPEMLREVL